MCLRSCWFNGFVPEMMFSVIGGSGFFDIHRMTELATCLTLLLPSPHLFLIILHVLMNFKNGTLTLPSILNIPGDLILSKIEKVGNKTPNFHKLTAGPSFSFCWIEIKKIRPFIFLFKGCPHYLLCLQVAV